jgi:CRP-like cAMP-binding protein
MERSRADSHLRENCQSERRAVKEQLTRERLEFVKNEILFKYLSKQRKRAMRHYLKKCVFHRGAVIYNQETDPHFVYFLTQGQCDVKKRIPIRLRSEYEMEKHNRPVELNAFADESEIRSDPERLCVVAEDESDRVRLQVPLCSAASANIPRTIVVPMASVVPPYLLGEEEAILGVKRRTTVTAASYVEVYSLPRPRLRELLRTLPVPAVELSSQPASCLLPDSG